MKSRKKVQKKRRIANVLGKSPINYFSDLFIVAMVTGWIIVVLIMVVMAIWATVNYCDTSMWADIANLVSIPLSCGGALWMLKNSVQHAIANNKGKQAKMDFPRVNADGEDDGNEEMAESPNDEEVMG